MVITEVRIKLMEDNNERLLAFCSITFDDMFVVRDLKIIEGARGCFVAMPSRKLTDRCPGCGCKNHLRARFCNQCGGKLDEDRAVRDTDGRAKLHADIAHPINSSCREIVQNSIISAYRQERERSKQPGYTCSYDDMDAEYEDTYSTLVSQLNAPPHRAHPAHGPRGNHAPRHDSVQPVAAHDDDHADGFDRRAAM